MKSKIIFAAVATCLIGLVFAAEDPGRGVIQFDHARVDAAFTKGGETLLKTNNFKIIAGRRGGPGSVEIHEKDTDVFYITEGTATFVTGGTPTEVKTNGPGEFLGKAIIGGQTNHLAKGDVMVIPNGVPHWFTETSVPFLYFVVKVAQ